MLLHLKCFPQAASAEDAARLWRLSEQMTGIATNGNQGIATNGNQGIVNQSSAPLIIQPAEDPWISTWRSGVEIERKKTNKEDSLWWPYIVYVCIRISWIKISLADLSHAAHQTYCQSKEQRNTNLNISYSWPIHFSKPSVTELVHFCAAGSGLPPQIRQGKFC